MDFSKHKFRAQIFWETPEILLFSKVVSVEEFYMLVKNDSWSIQSTNILKIFQSLFIYQQKNFLYSNSSLTNACFTSLYEVFLKLLKMKHKVVCAVP